MFGSPGVAYGLIYGLHHCLNVVTEREGYPAAVLIRAIELHTGLVDGPGRVCRALRIDRRFNWLDLTQGRMLWIEERGARWLRDRIAACPRIGVAYAGPKLARSERVAKKKRGPVDRQGPACKLETMVTEFGDRPRSW